MNVFEITDIVQHTVSHLEKISGIIATQQQEILTLMEAVHNLIESQATTNETIKRMQASLPYITRPNQ